MNHRKWAVITGASSGIGAEFAKQLSADGYDILLVARRQDRLLEVQNSLNGHSEILVCNLAEQQEIRQLTEWIWKNQPVLLINNAGFGKCGEFAQCSVPDSDMIRVNVCAAHDLTLETLRMMEEQGCGNILNVASSAGLLPCGPYMADYYATKAFVTSMTMGIAEELRRKRSPVRIFCLCPGPVDTEFNEVAQVRFSIPGITAEQCVRTAIRGMQRKNVLIVPSALVRTGLFLQRFVPRELVIRIVARSQKRKLASDR